MSAETAPRPSIEDRIRAALWFSERGFGIFTVWSATPDGVCRCPKKRDCDNAGKHPIGHQGFLENTRDPDRIRTLLAAGSEPNYGLVCPDAVFVLDVDGEGVARLVELETQHGPLPPTLRTNTANGQHVFLRWPAGLPRPIGHLFGYVTRWGSGSNAGYVIGPRSVHASGAVYAPASAFVEIAELPESWAHALIAPAAAEEMAIEIEPGGYELPEPGYSEARYDAIRDYIASRYMRGLSRDEILAGVLTVLAPRFADPLTEDEIRVRFDRAWKGTPGRLGEPTTSNAVVEITAQQASRGVLTEALPEWPEEPDDAVYHGPVGEIVQLVARRTEADPVGILGTLLASAGACMGHWRYIHQGSAQAANLFVVLVGESSSGRKGTAGSIAREVMTAAYPDWQKLIVAGLGSGEGLISRLGVGEKPEHRALVMESEFGRLLTVMGRDGSTLSPVVRDAWDGVPMGRFLAREQALVTWHHVSMVAHITPVELRAKLTNVDAANGFGNRFLWLAVRRTRLMPFPESPKGLITPHLLTQVNQAIDAAQVPGEVPWSEAAREYWEVLYTDLAMEPRVGLLGALSARIEAQIVRLALVYALLDRSSTIDLEHLHAGRALWDYAARSVRYVFGASTGNRDADTLRTYLADGPMEWENAKKVLGLRRGSDLEDAVRVLAELGVAETVTVPRSGGGRPRRVIRTPGQTLQTMQRVQASAQGRGEN